MQDSKIVYVDYLTNLQAMNKGLSGTLTLSYCSHFYVLEESAFYY